MPEIESARGVLSFPDPATWPRNAVRDFQRARGSRSIFEIAIFVHSGDLAALHMEDAIAGASILPIFRNQWYTHTGYPILIFSMAKLAEYKTKLCAAGYRVVVMERVADCWQGNVVDISSARERVGRRQNKWA